jgi:hypothetical protein
MAVRRSYDFERHQDGGDATLKVDYDGVVPVRKIAVTGKYLKKRRFSIKRLEVSKTRKGHHLRIWLDKEIGPYTTLLLQSMLGDDPQRQKFNRIRVRRHKHGWNVLFNAKYRGKSARMEEVPDNLTTTVVWKKIMQESADPIMQDIVSKSIQGDD